MFDEEDDRILHNLKEALSVSPAWDERGFLRLASEGWVALSEVGDEAPSASGLYALGLSVGLRYDLDSSRIAYLGSTKDIKKRLLQHKNGSHNRMIGLLQEEFPDGLSATWWPIPDINRKFLFAIEGEAVEVFERTFGSIPICNSEIPEFFEGQEYCKGMVQFARDPTESLITLEGLANRLGRVLVRAEISPPGGGAVLTFGAVPAGFVRSAFRSVCFLTEDELRRQEQHQAETNSGREQAAEFEAEMRRYELALVHDKNVATWSVEKMRDIISICGQLRAKGTRSKLVRPFEAPFRKVPEPHTWGEVALIKARMMAGSWEPERRVWVKIVHGKDLLGEGRFNKGWFIGEDKSDLPQRQTKRPVSREYEYEPGYEPPEEIEEKEVIYGLEVTTWKAVQDDFEDRFEEEMEQARQELLFALEGLFQKAVDS